MKTQKKMKNKNKNSKRAPCSEASMLSIKSKIKTLKKVKNKTKTRSGLLAQKLQKLEHSSISKVRGSVKRPSIGVKET